MAMRTDPTLRPMYGGFAALRAAVGGSWEWPGMQQPDGVCAGGIAAHSSGPRVRPVTAQQCVAAPDQFGSVVPGRASQYHQYVMSDPTAESSHV